MPVRSCNECQIRAQCLPQGRNDRSGSLQRAYLREDCEGRLVALQRRLGRGKASRLCPGSSDVNLFSYGEGIIDFDAEIPDGALDLGMSQQQLHGT